MKPQPLTESRYESREAANTAAFLNGVLDGGRRHFLLLLVCAVVGGGIASLYALGRPTMFEASSVLRIDPSRAGSLGVSEPGRISANEVGVIQSEIGVMKSDAVMIRALQSLPSATFTELVGYRRSPGMFEVGADVFSDREERALRGLTAATTARLIDDTQLVRVTVRHTSPHAAAALANQLIASYGEHSIAGRASSVSQLRTWMTAQMESLLRDVERSQQKLANFQEAHDILGTDATNNTVTDRLRMLNERLTAAQADRMMKEGQRQAAEVADASLIVNLAANPMLTELQRQQGLAYGHFAQLSAKFGENFPPLMDVKKQTQAIEAAITANVEQVRARLSQEEKAARGVENILRTEYREQTRTAYSVNRNQAEYAVLQGEVAANRELYNSLRSKLHEAAVEAEVSGVNVMLVDNARPPIVPLGPTRTLVAAAGVMVGLFAGVAVAVFFESRPRPAGVPTPQRPSSEGVNGHQVDQAVLPYVEPPPTPFGDYPAAATPHSLFKVGRVHDAIHTNPDLGPTRT